MSEITQEEMELRKAVWPHVQNIFHAKDGETIAEETKRIIQIVKESRDAEMRDLSSLATATRDELREDVADAFRAFVSEMGGGEDWSQAYYDHADRTIALVTAARDAEIREALLSDKAKNASAHEMQELSAQGVIRNHTLAFYGMKAALAAIGLHGDGTGGQG